MKIHPLVTGIVSFLSPIPMFVFTVLWSWGWFFGIGMGMLNYTTVPPWMTVIVLLPLLISPLLGIVGVVHGIIKIREKLSWLGVVLSVLCLMENFALIYGLCYLGSRF